MFENSCCFMEGSTEADHWVDVRNCGPFLWLDLGNYMSERTVEEETILAYRMLDHGVWLATGESFMSEVPGWFRITFAVDEADFRFGFER